ncbi:hypothetical protein RJ639_047579, partial [Escallonia herrerae]
MKEQNMTELMQESQRFGSEEIGTVATFEGGQNHHRIGSLLPPEGQLPKFAQLYDSQNEVANRMSVFSKVDGSSPLDNNIVEKLVHIFDINNEIWILDLGNGDLPTYNLENETDPAWIKVPSEFLIPSVSDPVQDIVNATYPNFAERYRDQEYLCSRAILTPNNESVDMINSYVLSTMPGDIKIYKSSDTICKASTN